MSAMPEPTPFVPDWPEPAARFLRDELPPPPSPPLDEVLTPRWAVWVRGAAEAKSAPPDYVLGALLSVCGSLVGNTRWASPWQGWAEPPILWTIAIGNPSMNKSPGLDAVLVPLKEVERTERDKVQSALTDWKASADVARLVESTWKEAVKAALKAGDAPPPRPKEANPGPEPVMPRLATQDATVEKLAVILAGQPRGALLSRDELAGWLQGMSRYSGGGSDRPFWLEAYGGRSYAVERMGRDPVYIDRLTVGVLGGIQPDRLRTLLLRSDDDGLLARFLPIWPQPAPIRRPSAPYDEAFIKSALQKMLTLRMATDESDTLRPWFVHFSEEARAMLDEFRKQAREWEGQAEGLLLSFIGKLPGMAVRVSLVLGMMAWASGEADEPYEITLAHFDSAMHLVERYLLPMARRAYADAAYSKGERAARRLVALIRDMGWRQFTSREVLRAERAGLATAEDLNPGLNVLEEVDIIHTVGVPPGPQGGRPQRLFNVNPALHRTRA
ncbi:YfjI family protein [Rubellimicrobium roseum]|uniref:DUF3987 domain-containing protein n=1 Tax=Rubellimicrobium roseum TaxID=687525 RepID=A0A5C4N8L4_9RHOB|nr:YfjI family protein [Rubellimicrobium roseum]TNC61329.1 DUF3987 domain-containing protein [Rubellimicrobium roseum]